MQIKDRQAQLIKELTAISPICFICQQSQQKKMCEILFDNTKCKKDICVICYNTHKNDPCFTCAQKLQEHYKKGKGTQKSSMFDEANKMYNRQYKIRSNEEFQTLDFDFFNLMAYYNAHPQVSIRKKFEEVQKQIKRILENKKKDQRTLISETQRIKVAKIQQKNHDKQRTGVQGCGYNRRYDKGINLLRVGWGYSPLTSSQFSNLNSLMNTKKEENEEIKEHEIAQLRLNKKMSGYQPLLLVGNPIKQQEQESNSQINK